MISSHPETDEVAFAASERADVDVDGSDQTVQLPTQPAARPRLKRLTKNSDSAAARRAKRKLRKAAKSLAVEFEPDQTSASQEEAKPTKLRAINRIRRVAPKADPESERRRKKLDDIRQKLREKNEAREYVRKSVLADRLKEAIRKSGSKTPTSTPNPQAADTKAAPTTMEPILARRKKKQPYVGWRLKPEVVQEVLDSRVASQGGSSNSSDAQAVTVEALQAEMELRRQLALTTAHFQLDAAPSLPVALPAASVASSVEVREVKPADAASAITPTPATPPDFPSETSREATPDHSETDAESASAMIPQSVPQSDPRPMDRTVEALPKPAKSAATAETDSTPEISFGHDAPGLSLVEPPPPEIEPYSRWFKRVVVRNRWLTWFTTFYIHWVVLLLLAAIIVHGPENTADLLLSAAFSVEEEPSTAPFEVTVPVPDPEPAPESAEEAIATEEAVSELDEEPLEINDDVLKELVPEGAKAADQSQAAETSEQKDVPPAAAMTQHVDMSPATAVRQGSFSVWTEPPNPRPGDPYRIIIQVRLPEKTTRYAVTDLEGVVVGSDGYRKPIPGFARGELPVVDGYARFAVPIVSADSQVRDTVYIRSRLLRETQKLLIEFN